MLPVSYFLVAQLTIIGRPSNVLTLHMVAAAHYFVRNNAPFRVGVMLVDDEDVGAGSDASDNANGGAAAAVGGDGDATQWPEDVWPRAQWADFAPASSSSSSSSSSPSSAKSATVSSSDAASVSASADWPVATLISLAFRYLAEVHAPVTAFAFLDSFKTEHVANKLNAAAVCVSLLFSSLLV